MSDDFTRIRGEKLDAYWIRTAEIRKAEAAARKHAAKARELEAEIEARRRAALRSRDGRSRTEG